MRTVCSLPRPALSVPARRAGPAWVGHLCRRNIPNMARFTDFSAFYLTLEASFLSHEEFGNSASTSFSFGDCFVVLFSRRPDVYV